jgi:hypothetical protein
MNFRRGSYRVPLEREPLGGLHRRFTIRTTAGRVARQVINRTQLPIACDVIVRVAYVRAGGNLGTGPRRGDRLGANITAAEDATLIADALIDVRNWNPTVTKIRDVRFVSIRQAVSMKDREIWEIRFVCEYMARWEMAGGEI